MSEAAPESPPSSTTLREATELRLEYHRLYLASEPAAAIPLATRACSILEQELGLSSTELAACLNDLGLLYTEQRSYEDAKVRFERALAIREQALGSEHPDVAASLNDLAAVYHEQGEYDEAEARYVQALSIRERSLGPVHPAVAASLNNLAGLYRAKAEYTRAMPLYERALAIHQEALGPDHLLVAASLNNLGLLHAKQAQYDRAEPLYERSLSIVEHVLGPGNPRIIPSLNNLGMLYLRQGEYERAEQMFQRSLFIMEVAPESRETAQCLNNLGALHQVRGEYEKAAPLYERALLIVENALGPEHLETATHLNNLGSLYSKQAQYDKAQSLHQRALFIREKALGPVHPEVANSLGNLASTYMQRGELAKAEPLYRRALSIFENAHGPTHPDVAASLTSLAALHFELGSRGSALELQRRALDIENRNMVRNLVDAEDSRRLAYASALLPSLHRILSLHLQAAPHHLPTAELALTTLLRRKGRMQDLSTQSPVAVRRAMAEPHQDLVDSNHVDVLSKSATIGELAAALPNDGALVELIRYEPRYHVDGRPRRDTGPPRYAAYLVFPDRIDWVDLGLADAIDDEVVDFRTKVLHEQPVSRDLYDAVMKPVVQRLGSTRQLFIAPDGELNRIPFGALYDGERYLVERYTLRFLTTGRDLLHPWATNTTPDATVLAVANPTGVDLPGTEREAELVAALFRGARTLLHDDATEARIREQPRPRLVHIGTHGFYDAFRSRREVGVAVRPRVASDAQRDEPAFAGIAGSLDNPMHRSGLQLAKDDARFESIENDGRLTAYEVSGWDLRGTELVVLSACGSGLGPVRSGEGVMGLRRAFAMAGAQTQVMSLWDLGDETTPKVMELYYRKLAAGLGRGEAMQQVQLELLEDEKYRHPKAWAAFVVVGEWAPLSGTPPGDGPPSLGPLRSCQASIDTSEAAGGTELAALFLLTMFARMRRRRSQAAARGSS